MKKGIILLLAAAFILGSCSNNALLNRKEDRLLGAWEFEDASFKEDGDLFRDNVDDEFEGDVIEFFGDGTALYDDFSLNAVFDGTWVLQLDRFDDNGESDAEFFLDMTFFDFVNRKEFSYFTNAITLTNNRMTLIANTRSGEYRFKLRKLN
ncbi:MAG: hypothetical protein AAGG68_04085 [Bacteroidota bacterium]